MPNFKEWREKMGGGMKRVQPDNNEERLKERTLRKFFVCFFL